MHQSTLKTMLLACLCMPALLLAQPVIIVDAGSSGTRLHDYGADATQNTLHESFAVKSKPGIASFIKGSAGQQNIDNAALNPYLDTLIIAAKQQGLSDLSAPVYFYATAGMRLQDKAIQTQLMQAIKAHLQSLGFTDVHSTVIDGQHEALYDWLSINQDALLKHQGNTTGVIDMGGASTEIAFAIKRNVRGLGNNTDRMHIQINNQNYNVFAKSYLGLGKDQALASIANKNPQSHDVCYPKGIWSDGSANFDWNQCHTQVSPVFDGHEHINLSYRRFKRSVPNTFIATSALYYNAQFLQQAPFAQWPQKTQQICTQDWDTIKEQYPNTPEQYMQTYCISSVYGQSMLSNLFGLQNKEIRFAKDDWALGAAMAFMIGYPMPGQ